MPHITVEYSDNLESDVDPRRLIAAVHRAALDSGIFELGAVRTRAARRDNFVVADGDPENAFVAVTIRIGPGRQADDRRRLAAAVMQAVTAETADAFARRGLSLSVEVQEIDNTAALRTNNLHQRMKAKYGAGREAAR